MQTNHFNQPSFFYIFNVRDIGVRDLKITLGMHKGNACMKQLLNKHNN